MAIVTYIVTVALNIKWISAPIKRYQLAEWTHTHTHTHTKTHIYAAYWIPTSNEGTHEDWKWEDGRRHCMPMEIKPGVAIITSEKHRQIDFKGLDLIWIVRGS